MASAQVAWTSINGLFTVNLSSHKMEGLPPYGGMDVKLFTHSGMAGYGRHVMAWRGDSGSIVLNFAFATSAERVACAYACFGMRGGICAILDHDSNPFNYQLVESVNIVSYDPPYIDSIGPLTTTDGRCYYLSIRLNLKYMGVG